MTRSGRPMKDDMQGHCQCALTPRFRHRDFKGDNMKRGMCLALALLFFPVACGNNQVSEPIKTKYEYATLTVTYSMDVNLNKKLLLSNLVKQCC